MSIETGCMKDWEEKEEDSLVATLVNKPKIGNPDPGAHYRFHYKKQVSVSDAEKGYVFVKLDPFRICDVYKITNLGQGTIVKKGLRLGTSIKDRKQDLLDIINAAERMLEMIEEDE